METGKVFEDSTDIYQDQAKILFDYYKTAAEKIISEEKQNEELQNSLHQRIADDQNHQKHDDTMFKIFLILAAVCAVLAFFTAGVSLIGTIVLVIFAVKNYMSVKHLSEDIQKASSDITNAQEQYRNIRRDYSVNKIGVVYVPVAVRVPYEGKSILTDVTGTTTNKEFHLNVLHQPENLSNSVKNLEDSLQNIPVVETNADAESIPTDQYSLSMQNVTLHDYVGNIDRQIRNISYLLNDSEEVSVDLPVIPPGSGQAEAISSFGTEDPGDAPVIDVFGDAVQSKLDHFASLNEHKNQMGQDGDITMEKLMSQLSRSVTILVKEKNASASKMMAYTTSILSNVLKAGYTEYSPELEADAIERVRNTDFDYQEVKDADGYEPFKLRKSSVVKLDIFSNNWVAEDNSRTSIPFGMHQIDEEILNPVISNLMEENRIERLHIYNNIEDQKREYLNKWNEQIHEYYRTDRDTADELINNMRETYTQYMSAASTYKSLKETADSMHVDKNIDASEVKERDEEAEMLAGFEEQTKGINKQQEELSEFMDRIQDSISSITKGFAHVQYYEGSLRDQLSHDTAVAMSDVNHLDTRRKNLLQVSPYVAKNAELQPAPKTSDELTQAVDIDLEAGTNQCLSELNAVDEGQ